MPLKRIIRGRIETENLKSKIKNQKSPPAPKPAAVQALPIVAPTSKPASEPTTPKSPAKPSTLNAKPSGGGSYSAKDITLLEGLEAVRKRPGMYIGSTGVTGLHHLVWEIIDNSIDEAMAGFCKEIIVTLKPDHLVEVRDDGRGIPVDIHPIQKISALEMVMTKLHAGGKFGNDGYKVSGGLHGVGASVVNALSTYVRAEVHLNGKIWEQEYKNGGHPVKKVAAIGNCKDHGTTITFRPDDTIFETINFEWKTIIDHVRQTAYLSKGVKIVIIDERTGEEKAADTTALAFPNPIYQFYFEGGIASYVRYIAHNKQIKNETVFYAEKMPRIFMWNWLCNTPMISPKLYSPSPTTFTIPKAARMCKDSAPRSPEV